MKDFSDALIKEYKQSLSEKWYSVENKSSNLWYSDSIFEFRSFLNNLPNTRISGLRLCIADGHYLAADASYYTHDMMIETAKKLYLIVENLKFEKSACGCPKYVHFDGANYGYTIDDDEPLEVSKQYTEASYDGMLCADCDSFEVLLPNFTESNVENSYTWKVLQPLCKNLYII